MLNGEIDERSDLLGSGMDLNKPFADLKVSGSP